MHHLLPLSPGQLPSTHTWPQINWLAHVLVTQPQWKRVWIHINKKAHLESRKGRAAVVVSSGRRLPAAQPGNAAAVERRLDGDGGVARTVEPKGLSVTCQGWVAADDPGEVVCGPQHWLEGSSGPRTLAQSRFFIRSTGSRVEEFLQFFFLTIIFWEFSFTCADRRVGWCFGIQLQPDCLLYSHHGNSH